MSIIPPVQAVVNSSLSVTVQFFIMDMSAYFIQADVAALSQGQWGTINLASYTFAANLPELFDDSWLCFTVF